jgi:hypothetical protein
MKKSKVISLVLLPLLICALILSPSVAAQGSDPQEAIIKQVVTTTAKDLGCNTENGYSAVGEAGEFKYWGIDCPGGCGIGWCGLLIVKYPSQQMAAQSVPLAWQFEFCYKSSFHGCPAALFTGGDMMEWQSGRFVFNSIGESASQTKQYAEVLYANAVKYGLIGGEVVEGVAFTINVQAPGYLPWSDTLATKDYEPSSITLEGVVKDEEGNPVSGATISIPDLGKSVTSGVQGNYKLYVQTEGTKPFTKVHNIILQKKITGANITL